MFARIPALIFLSAAALIHSPVSAQTGSAAKPCSGLYNFQFNRLQDDVPQNLCQYAGQVALVVNTASYCGYTNQYEGLEKLYARYRERGLVVLGFPSNDFEQEPGDSKLIADFCFNTYGVKFPMFAKSHVKGSAANPLYQALQRESASAPRWNFHKYLVARDGVTVRSFATDVDPGAPHLLRAVEATLG